MPRPLGVPVGHASWGLIPPGWAEALHAGELGVLGTPAPALQRACLQAPGTVAQLHASAPGLGKQRLFDCVVQQQVWLLLAEVVRQTALLTVALDPAAAMMPAQGPPVARVWKQPFVVLLLLARASTTLTVPAAAAAAALALLAASREWLQRLLRLEIVVQQRQWQLLAAVAEALTLHGKAQAREQAQAAAVAMTVVRSVQPEPSQLVRLQVQTLPPLLGARQS